MQPPPSDYYTYPKTVPESTCDINLKRARVVDAQGNSYIRMTGASTSADLTPITDALGQTTDPAWDGQDASATIISLLKSISNEASDLPILNEIQVSNYSGGVYTYTKLSFTYGTIDIQLNNSDQLVRLDEYSDRLGITVYDAHDSTRHINPSGTHYYCYIPSTPGGAVVTLADTVRSLKMAKIQTDGIVDSYGGMAYVVWDLPYDLTSIVS